ncbi:hypothetical protein DSL72_007963 [Monilinia vaccinii-corymbosi]|uniref:Uncharacterized protein n=1 Tax=Monilinia vaccinii-corymbosi TaxID=61207 RepID=A0A8A3PJA4_9HELO|nr:hypothetical protein DSL72_007963 [Monilinia vaccinii-corymbosi]
MPSLETASSPSSGAESPPPCCGTSSGSSSPEINTSNSPLLSAPFVRSFKGRAVPPTLVGISEEAMIQRFVKMTPTMKVMSKGKDVEVTTFTHYEACPELVDTSIPTKEVEIDTAQTDKSTIIKRSPSLASFPTTQGQKPNAKAYKPCKSLGHKEGRKLKQMIEKENDGIFEDTAVESEIGGEAYAEFNTAPSSPVRCLSVAGRRDLDGPYDDRPKFPSGATIQDFGVLPDHLRGPCFEVSPRTSVLDGPHAIPNMDKFLAMNKDDVSVGPSLVRPLESVQESSSESSSKVAGNCAGNCMGQSDGAAPARAMLPDVGGDSPVPDLPTKPLEKEKKSGKRTHNAINKFRSGVRKSRSRCLRTPVLVVLVGKELSKPTRTAIENIASGLPSGIGDVKPLPA